MGEKKRKEKLGESKRFSLLYVRKMRKYSGLTDIREKQQEKPVVTTPRSPWMCLRADQLGLHVGGANTTWKVPCAQCRDIPGTQEVRAEWSPSHKQKHRLATWTIFFLPHADPGLRSTLSSGVLTRSSPAVIWNPDLPVKD